MVDEILATRVLDSKSAERLAGRLNFASQAVAGASGSARIVHIYSAVFCRDTYVNDELFAELVWWSAFLQTQTPRLFNISNINQNTVTLFTDVDGSVGIGGVMFYNDSAPVQYRSVVGCHFTKIFKRRKTYIIPLELMAVVVAIRLFSSQLQGS